MAKLSLPLVAGLGAPTVDAARKRFGGRIIEPQARRAGEIVALRGDPGVVLFASAREIDVFMVAGVVRRTSPSNVTPFDGETPAPLERIAADARAFASLDEGDRVRYEIEGGEIVEGVLAEKCRYGALVVSGEGKVVALGFRKVWPARESTRLS